MQAAASLPARLAALALVIGGAPLLDNGSSGTTVAVGLVLCVLLGTAVGRYAAALVPLAVLAVIAIVNYANSDQQVGLASGIFFVALLGAVGAIAVIVGVALHKALRREPSAI